MRRFKSATLIGLSLVLVISCRTERRQPPSAAKPTWSFGVVRGTSATRPGDARSPIQLTASDGTGLKLVSLDAKIAIEGPLAYTELTMGFENPLDRTLEGRFDVVLPTGAAVSRFAMRLPAGWQEAEVVEKQAARVAYEDFLHRRQDPALLEKAPGNEFSARVFPIAPHAVKEIKLSYSQELPSVDEPYRLPLRGLPLVPALQIVVWAGETALRVARQQFTPDADFLLERPGAASGLQSGKLVAARLRPPLPTAPAAPTGMAGVVILFDTSASRAPGFAQQVASLGTLIEELRRVHGDGLPLRVASFDQDVAPLYAGTAGGFAHDAKALLDGVVARGALGASDLAGALTWAARAGGEGHQRLIVITDGVATASAGAVAEKIEEAGDDALALGRAADLLKPNYDRLDVILVGGLRDDAAMRALVTHHLAQDGTILNGLNGLDGAEDAGRLVRRLGEATRSVQVSVKDAAWVWPTRVDGMQRGDDLIVYAEMSDARARDAVTVTLTGSADLQVEVPLASPATAGLRPLVERAWARARIASLGVEAAALPEAQQEAQQEAQRETPRERAAALKKEIIDLSTRYRVLSDHTALLILESEADYARFHIDRHALADILVVDDRGLHLEHRQGAVLNSEPAKPRDVELQTLRRLRRYLRQPVEADKAIDEASASALPDAEEDRAAARGALDSIASRARAASYRGAADSDDVTGGDGLLPESLGEGIAHLAFAPGSPGAHASRESPPPAFAPPVAEPASPRAIARPRNVRAPAPPRPSDSSVEAFSDRLVADRRESEPPPDTGAPPWSGKMLEVMNLVAQKQLDAALARARAWRAEEPGDVLALVALGNVYRAQGQLAGAARAYGSIIDLFPGRADLRRFAGDLLEALGAAGEALAADSFAHAVRDRPDHPSSHRLRAYALLRAGHLAAAFSAIEAGASRTYPSGRFLGADRILREDAGLIAAAWLRKEPARRAEVEQRLAKLGAALATRKSLRFVLTWETDANDVDFHIRDRAGHRAWYSQKHLASGGDLYEDVTTGYGPECFSIAGPAQAYPYRIQAHYYSRGPMGYGMGKVEVLEHDGAGGLRFDERPFVVMNDQAFVDLGTVDGPLAAR